MVAASAVATYRIDLGYDGNGFIGSQRQPGVRTVQGELEAALARLCGRPVLVVLAGRTDRGVHAVGQVASARLAWARGVDALEGGLRALVPPDMAIYSVRQVAAGFHARFDAQEREYRYRIWNGMTPPILLRRFAWHVRAPLDVDAMIAAARSLVGTHDFSTFASGGRGIPGTAAECVRTIMKARWRTLPEEFEPQRGGAVYELQVVADGFLPQMVRNVVGAQVMIGRGMQPPGWLEWVREQRDRRLLGAPAPPDGLVLWRVAYVGDTQGDKEQGDDEDVFTEGL